MKLFDHSRPLVNDGKRSRETVIPLLFFAAVALFVTAPFFFTRGYVFLLDMVWGPGMTMADKFRSGIDSGLPLFFVHRALGTFIPNDILQKFFLWFALFLPGASFFLLARRYFPVLFSVGAGLFFLMNPFVEERFLAGHWIVLLGYGFLPLFLLSLLDFLEKFDKKRFLHFAFFYTLFPLVSLHMAYIATPLLFLTASFSLLFKTLREKEPLLLSRKAIASAMIAFGSIFLLGNGFWLLRFFDDTQPFSEFGNSDFETFAPIERPDRNVFLSALGLSGFWNDDFFTTEDLLPFRTPLVLSLVLLSFVGALSRIRKRDPLALALVFLFFPTLLLSIGFGSPITRPITEWCLTHIPLFRGLRDTSKLLALIALSYAFFLPHGILVVLSAIKEARVSLPKKMVITKVFTIIFLFLPPFFLSGTLLWGESGQLRGTPYPKEWARANELVNSDPNATILFALPWKSYLTLHFSEEAFVASPANPFFTAPVLTAKNTGNPRLSSTGKSPWDETALLLQSEVPSIRETGIRELSRRGVSHIVLLKTDEWKPFIALGTSRLLETLMDTDTIALYVIRAEK